MNQMQMLQWLSEHYLLLALPVLLVMIILTVLSIRKLRRLKAEGETVQAAILMRYFKGGDAGSTDNVDPLSAEGRKRRVFLEYRFETLDGKVRRRMREIPASLHRKTWRDVEIDVVYQPGRPRNHIFARLLDSTLASSYARLILFVVLFVGVALYVM